MADRMLAWLSAGVLAAGLSAATVAGAATAAADDDPGANVTTSQSTEPADTETAIGTEKPLFTKDSDDEDPDATEKPVAEEETEDHAEDESVTPEGAAEEVEGATETGSGYDEPSGIREPESIDDSPDSSVAEDQGLIVADEAQVGEDVELSQASDPAAYRKPTLAATTDETVAAVEAEPLPATERLLIPAVEDTRAPLPSLLNVVGTFFWGLFDLVTKVIDVPPAVPPGSTLTAGRSRLEIDCGDGYTADADWYFPTEGEPDKLIYFQHGFPARAGFYNLTLQELAQRNNAIVVAPSITSNIFACDACAAGGEPMHAAVARLFEGDRAALLASARAAGYEGSLPEQFVFTGQSAGASLAIGAAGFYYQRAQEAEKANMVGVLLYDVSPLGGAKVGNALTNGLEKLPTSVPVLNIAAEPNIQNSQGGANAIFTEQRPGQFNGIQIVGGAHSDAFQSNVLFGIPQLLVSVLFGFSTQQNVEAVQVLTTGWLNDMYELRVYDPEKRTGIYGVPGEPSEVVVDIPTSEGPASGYVLPAKTRAPSFFDRLTNAFFGLINVNLYAGCADPVESASAQKVLSCAV